MSVSPTAVNLQLSAAALPEVVFPIGVGGACSGSGNGAGAEYACPPDAKSVNSADPGFTLMATQLSFVLSGGGDITHQTGSLSLRSVPEPATALLFTLGLGGLAAARRLIARRRR